MRGESRQNGFLCILNSLDYASDIGIHTLFLFAYRVGLKDDLSALRTGIWL